MKNKNVMYWIAYWVGRSIKAVQLGYRHGYDHSVKTDHITRIRDLLRADPERNYVPAIKEYRSAFGSSLVDAKNAIDTLKGEIL